MNRAYQVRHLSSLRPVVPERNREGLNTLGPLSDSNASILSSTAIFTLWLPSITSFQTDKSHDRRPLEPL